MKAAKRAAEQARRERQRQDEARCAEELAERAAQERREQEAQRIVAARERSTKISQKTTTQGWL